MNQKRAKQIRELTGVCLNAEDKILKKQYRVAKRQYTRLSPSAKKEFLTLLKEVYNN